MNDVSYVLKEEAENLKDTVETAMSIKFFERDSKIEFKSKKRRRFITEVKFLDRVYKHKRLKVFLIEGR